MEHNVKNSDDLVVDSTCGCLKTVIKALWISKLYAVVICNKTFDAVLSSFLQFVFWYVFATAVLSFFHQNYVIMLVITGRFSHVYLFMG